MNKREFDKIKSATNYDRINLKLVHEENVLEGINEYVNSNDVDVLAMTIKKRTLFDRIFNKSLTKKWHITQGYLCLLCIECAQLPDNNLNFFNNYP